MATCMAAALALKSSERGLSLEARTGMVFPMKRRFTVRLKPLVDQA